MKKAETKKQTTVKEVKAPVATIKSQAPKKPAVKSTAAVKTTVAAKSTATEKTTAAKTAAVKKTTAAKPAAAKKTAVKPAAAPKKAAEKALEPKIVLQYGEISLDQETLLANVQNFLQYDRDMPVADQVGVEIYVKPEEGKAYVVVNGVEEGSMLL